MAQDHDGLDVRVGDQERATVADALAAAVAAGQLTPDEHAERMELALRARTRGDLASLTADLPPVAPDAAVEERVRRKEQRHALARSWRSWAGVAILLTVIWALSGFGGDGPWNPHSYWPVWPIGVWGAVLLMRTITGSDDD